MDVDEDGNDDGDDGGGEGGDGEHADEDDSSNDITFGGLEYSKSSRAYVYILRYFAPKVHHADLHPSNKWVVKQQPIQSDLSKSSDAPLFLRYLASSL